LLLHSQVANAALIANANASPPAHAKLNSANVVLNASAPIANVNVAANAQLKVFHYV